MIRTFLITASALACILPGAARSELPDDGLASQADDRRRCLSIQRRDGDTIHAVIRIGAQQTCTIEFTREAASAQVTEQPRAGRAYVLQNGSASRGFTYTARSASAQSDSFTLTAAVPTQGGRRSWVRALISSNRTYTIVVSVEIGASAPDARRPSSARAAPRAAPRTGAPKPNEPPPAWVTGPTQ
jgi:hypothetical protein